ncbi:MAG: polysaccharide biosynthesis/export family protein [Acidobacteriota bacterium]
MMIRLAMARRRMAVLLGALLAASLGSTFGGPGAAQAGQVGAAVSQVSQTTSQAVAQPSVDAGEDYLLGPTDVLSVVFWGEKDLSMEVTIRPDGKISLPLLNDVVAAGLTTEQLRHQLTERAKRFLAAPVVAVVLRQVNNNKVFVTGQVLRPGPYVVTGPTTILQVLALAGGFTDFADRKHILITRIENGVQQALTFNYDEVVKKRDLSQNIILKPGDTVVVP